VRQPMTTTLYSIIQSELIKKGLNEFVDTEGNLVLFDEEFQFMTKILTYDPDVQEIVNQLFQNVSLNDPIADTHFKKSFLYRFINRQLNRQTIEAFKLVLLSTFLTHQSFINTLYKDIELYTTQGHQSNTTGNQLTTQLTESLANTDNRQAYAQLPQSTVQLDVNSTIMESANDNTISRNKQTNNQENTSDNATTNNIEAKTYQLETLLQTSEVFEQTLDTFDKKCFLQFW